MDNNKKILILKLNNMKLYIDIDEIYANLDEQEKSQLIDWLTEDGYTDDCECDDCECDNSFVINNPSLQDKIWIDNMKKLFYSRHQLSADDESIILAIINKL